MRLKNTAALRVIPTERPSASACFSPVRPGERNGLTQPGTCGRIRSLLEKYRLPVACDAPLSTLLQLAANDKKRMGDSIHFILLRKIGDSFTLPLSLNQLPSFFGCDK